MILHQTKKTSVLNKHTEVCHTGDNQPPTYRMRAVRGSRTVLDRVVAEGILISSATQSQPDQLMNSKSEGGRNKLVRYGPQVQRI